MTFDSLHLEGDRSERITISDQVFIALHQRIITLDLPPGTKMSEAEIARQLGVSRQPVRDAFFRLVQIGLIRVQPQRATTVCPISETEVFNAQFIRLAIELATIRRACRVYEDKKFGLLDDLIERQKAAVQTGDALGFHALDDAFHRAICEGSGCGFAWTLIKEKKTYMDRVRYLSIAFGAESTLLEHLEILNALKSRDVTRCELAMRNHLSAIGDMMRRIRVDHEDYFSPERGDLL